MTLQETEEYDPPEGARVEVLVTDEQESWWEGEVRQKKGGFYVINFPEEGEMVNNHPNLFFNIIYLALLDAHPR